MLSYYYCFIRKDLKSKNSLLNGMLCLVPFMKAAKRSGIVTSLEMILSTVSLNLAG